jgi:hypothetical protein
MQISFVASNMNIVIAYLQVEYLRLSFEEEVEGSDFE